jgi:PAS domain S-box-containing protein
MKDIVQELKEVRALGREIKDRGVLEVDTSSGSIGWMNKFALDTMGYTIDQVSSMSVFDISPEKFHDRVREDIVEDAAGRVRKFYVMPSRTADGKVAWWYVLQTRVSGTRHWAFAEHIQTTPQSGPQFAFMTMQMDIVNSRASADLRLGELDDWVQQEISRIDGDVNKVRSQVAEVKVLLENAEAAALSAAAESIAAKNASLATQQEMKRYATKEEIEGHFSKFGEFEEERNVMTREILRLIKSESAQQERLKAYEDHVKKTTETAVKAIEAQASKSGRGLSRKVTVPLFVITTLAMVLQYAIQRWGSSFWPLNPP